MESPPSTSAWSEAFILSDDSGLLLTSGSISSGSMSGESRSGYGQLPLEFQDSDCEDKSFSQADDSLDGMSDIICGENFNTLKKGPNWNESATAKTTSPIEPPLEFQDRPNIYDNIADVIAKSVISAATTTLVQSPTPPPPLTTPTPPKTTVTTHLVPIPPPNSLPLTSNHRHHFQPVTPPPPRPPPILHKRVSLVPHSSLTGGATTTTTTALSLTYTSCLWQPDFMPYSPVHTYATCSSTAGGGSGGYYSTATGGGGGGGGVNVAGRPSSRSSLASSRRSSSHNSLAVSGTHAPDDSGFITQAVSHDTLGGQHTISDLYTVPFDSDVYAVPVDEVRRPPTRGASRSRLGLGAATVQHKKRRRNTSGSCRELERQQLQLKQRKVITSANKSSDNTDLLVTTKRHSVAGPSSSSTAYSNGTVVSTALPISATSTEPIHMSLQEVRQYLQRLYSSGSSDSSGSRRQRQVAMTGEDVTGGTRKRNGNVAGETGVVFHTNNNKYPVKEGETVAMGQAGVISDKEFDGGGATTKVSKKNTFLISIKNKKVKDSSGELLGSPKTPMAATILSCKADKRKKAGGVSLVFSLKQALCNMFRIRRILSPDRDKRKDDDYNMYEVTSDEYSKNLINRALPPLPSEENGETIVEEPSIDFATSIQKVKDYGWYWGPLSSEGAEKILSNEPHGSFIVRDSSDDHYIFSLTFKLNSSVRHVRIDHDQGNFSFGSCTRFKSQTIVEFIQNAVEHSRSGRYLFFLHRRPVIGPVRVQLLHPVSRFKQTQSLQHMCRFVILKQVRKDLIPSLPLPRRMIDYLNAPHYYSEHLLDVERHLLSAAAAAITASSNLDPRDSESSSNDAEVRAVLGNHHHMETTADSNYMYEPRRSALVVVLPGGGGGGGAGGT